MWLEGHFDVLVSLLAVDLIFSVLVWLGWQLVFDSSGLGSVVWWGVMTCVGVDLWFCAYFPWSRLGIV